MDRPLHECFDGDCAPDDLSPEQRRELSRLEALIESATGPIRTAPVPDLTARVMMSIAATEVDPPLVVRAEAAARGFMDWLWTPRHVRLRPAYGAILAMVWLLAVVAAPPLPSTPASPQADAGMVGPPEIYVQFRVEAHGATQVALAGTFTGWRPEYALREAEPGVWSILLPLRPGVHDYAFVVDGHEWVTDPHAFQIDDGFGGVNSRIALPTPSPRTLRS